MRLQVLISAAIIAVGLLTASLTTAADKPNIVIILADDLGNADLGYGRCPPISRVAWG